MENYHNISCEPMDIDVSGHSVREMDISFNDSVDNIKTIIKTEKPDVPTEELQLTRHSVRSDCQTVVKKYHIHIQKPTKSYKNVVFHILSGAVIILISILTCYIYTIECCNDFNTEVLRNTFSNKLFGQTEAINVIIKTLDIKERSKLMFFIGGTGVGKTFASSILLDTVGSCSNVYHYTMPSFTSTFSTDYMFGLTMCKMSLIIVDDLTANDMHVKKQIKDVIEKSENLGKDITMILIYNCYESTKDFIKKCDESFHKRILKNFAEIKVLQRFVEFKPLSETHLKECIKQELGERKFDDEEYRTILKNFNVTVDGCKGVHSKMKYMNIV